MSPVRYKLYSYIYITGNSISKFSTHSGNLAIRFNKGFHTCCIRTGAVIVPNLQVTTKFSRASPTIQSNQN
jgi:hypothetical protein